MKTNIPSPLSRLIPTFTFIRTIFNTMHRMAYPFLGTFTRSLGVDVDAFARLLADRAFAGALVPFLFPLIEQRGRKFGMLLGLAMFLCGLGLVIFWPTYITLAAALILGTAGKYVFDPSMQAFLGDRIPYGRRGLMIALTEFGWSLAFIIGVPVCGFLIVRWGWIAPFPLFAILAVSVFLYLLKSLPPERTTEKHKNLSFFHFHMVLTSPASLTALCIGLFSSAGNELVNLIFGVWLEDSFNLQITALAAAAAVIGISELSAEGMVAAFADRLGKPLSISLGLGVNCLAALALPLLGKTIPGALAGLFLFYISYEFMLVTDISFMTEVLPQSRATLMAFNIAGLSLGRAIGALLAPTLYGAGFWSVVIGAVVFNLLAFAGLAATRFSRTVAV